MGVNLNKKGFPFVKKTNTESNSGSDIVNWSNIQNKPSKYPPTAHTHEINEIIKDVADI